jgi:hypothetical protein
LLFVPGSATALFGIMQNALIQDPPFEISAQANLAQSFAAASPPDVRRGYASRRSMDQKKWAAPLVRGTPLLS